MIQDFKDKIELAISTMEGWCWIDKAVGMADIILSTKPAVVVELGVFGGKSLIPQALACQENGRGIAFGIDSWKTSDTIQGEDDAASKEWWSKMDMDAILAGCTRSIWSQQLDKYCVLIRSRSDQASTLFGSHSIDVLHIDGNHSEEVSCGDVSIWLPKVKPGGYIWFDDCNWKSTEKAVAMMNANCNVVLDISKPDIGSCRLFQKR